uniref:Uncharacterized protein n=1 Tax=Arion vulgaris TaxID=1028688 RepID=A0A0B6ZQG6_9EUPU
MFVTLCKSIQRGCDICTFRFDTSIFNTEVLGHGLPSSLQSLLSQATGMQAVKESPL